MKTRNKIASVKMAIMLCIVAALISCSDGGSGGSGGGFENGFENPWQEPTIPGEGGEVNQEYSIHKFASGCNGTCAFGLDNKRYDLAVALPQYCVAKKCNEMQKHVVEAFKAFDDAIEVAWEKRIGDYHDRESLNGVTGIAVYKYSWNIGDGKGTKKAPCLTGGDLFAAELAAIERINEIHHSK